MSRGAQVAPATRTGRLQSQSAKTHPGQPLKIPGTRQLIHSASIHLLANELTRRGKDPTILWRSLDAWDGLERDRIKSVHIRHDECSFRTLLS